MLKGKKRIIVIGCPGAGKSTLSIAMAKRLGLPLVHLDALFWKPGWIESEQSEFDAKVQAAVNMPEWIIDGNYARTLPMRLERCDAVVYLDFPRSVCLFGVIKRYIKNRGKTRADMGGGCEEKIDIEFIKYVWRFKKANDKKQKQLVTDSGMFTVILKSRRDIKRFLEEA